MKTENVSPEDTVHSSVFFVNSLDNPGLETETQVKNQ